MASVKKGTLTRSPQWWKHLREYKRFFWKSERQAYKTSLTSKSRWQKKNSTASTMLNE